MHMVQWPKAVSIQVEQCQATPENWLNWLYLADAYQADNRDFQTHLDMGYLDPEK